MEQYEIELLAAASLTNVLLGQLIQMQIKGGPLTKEETFDNSKSITIAQNEIAKIIQAR